MPGGISIITNFDVQGQFPIDSRMVVSNLTTRDGLLMSVRYEGLRVYVLSERQSYVWQDGTWRVEYNGIYGGSGSLPGNVTVDFGSMSTTVGSASYYFEYEAGFDSMQSFLQSKFIRHSSNVIGSSDMWRGVEFRQQLKYNDGLSPFLKKDSSYISFNPSTSGTSGQDPGGLAFGTGYLVSNIPITERMRITSDGRVGIGTNDPKEFLQIGSNSSTQIPFVIHNGSNSAIASNWYYTTSDQYFSQTRGSTRIQFENGEIHFSTRNPNVGSSVLNEAMRIKDKKVGIGTITPNELLQIGDYTSTQLPLVLHNSGDAAIGHNWYFTTPGGSQYNDPTKGSGRIKFAGLTGEILFSTRNPNATTGFNSTMILKDSKVGVNTINPSYALDVTGDIRSSDKIRTTNGYFFENSPSNKITSSSNQMFFHVDNSPNFVIFLNQNVSYKELQVSNNSMKIIDSTGTNFTKFDHGVQFVEDPTVGGSVIYGYREDSISRIGLTVYSKYDGLNKESLRISDAGTRIQLGNRDNAVTDFRDRIYYNTIATLNSFSVPISYSNSAIDTKELMHMTYDSLSNRPNLSYLFNIIKSGDFTYSERDDTNAEPFTVTQHWTRIGKIIYVNFKIIATDLSGRGIQPFSLQSFSGGTNYLYNIIPLAIELNANNVVVQGSCAAAYTKYPNFTPSTYNFNNPDPGNATNLIISLSTQLLVNGQINSCLKFSSLSGGGDPDFKWFYYRIYGSYTIHLS